jgi:hypothetical protein
MAQTESSGYHTRKRVIDKVELPILNLPIMLHTLKGVDLCKSMVIRLVLNHDSS